MQKISNLPINRKPAKGVEMYTLVRIPAILFLLAALLSAQNLSSMYTIQLNGPANSEQISQAKTNARSLLKTEIAHWLKNSHEFNFDSTAALVNFNLEILTDSCLNRCKEESSFKGKELTLFYSLSQAAADEALDAFNKAVEDTVKRTWTAMNKALENNNTVDYFENAIKTYSYSFCQLGESFTTPESTNTIISEKAQKAVQSLFNRMKIQSSDMIIQGKIGRTAEQPPIVTVVIDSIPLPGLWFSGNLQVGKSNFTAPTNEQGQLSLKELVIPLVSNGALFYLTPNIGKMLGASFPITPRDMKIQLKDGQIQTFMFKVSRPSFTLNYKVSSDPSVKLPTEFNSDAPLKKYLRDSCFLADAQTGLPPDFMITVESIITSTATDITEENGLKMNAEITIKGLSLETPRTEIKKVELVKRFGKQTDIPYGLFLWDFNNILKQSTRTILSSL
jgi:hypothetical protein